jgi:hypothetical protein
MKKPESIFIDAGFFVNKVDEFLQLTFFYSYAPLCLSAFFK